MYTLDSLLQDVSQKRGRLQGGSDAGASSQKDYEKVWTCLEKYLVSCLDQRRGLSIPNFCKIGWQIEKRRQGSKTVAQHRPFFQIAETWGKAHCSPEAQRRLGLPLGDRELCPFEDFNFSKAAIKFSGSLTKDQVFTGLKSIIQQIGEVVGEGREVSIDLGELGRLLVRERDPKFAFAPEIYVKEGLEPPISVQEGHQKSNPAFRRDGTPAQAKGLGIRGNKPSAASVDCGPSQIAPEVLSVDAPENMDADYYNEEEDSFQPLRGPESGVSQRSRRLHSSGSAPSLGSPGGSSIGGMEFRRSPLLTAQQFKREVAFKEAMDRHITEMEGRATEAMREKDSWKSHIRDCKLQEADDHFRKRAVCTENSDFLREQVKWNDAKRVEGRSDFISAASAHDFPKFSETGGPEMQEFVKGQQARLRHELDQQVRVNTTLRNLAKHKERKIEVSQLEANRSEMSMLRDAHRDKKAYEREALSTAWNSDIRMKNIWKAIETSTASQAPQVEQLPTLSRGGSAASTGRLLTGASRRVPLGAGVSLDRQRARLTSSAGSLRL